MKTFVFTVTVLLGQTCLASGYGYGYAAPVVVHPLVVPQPVVQVVPVVQAVPAVQVVPVHVAPVVMRTVHFTRYPLRGGPRGLFGVRGRTRDRAYLDMARRAHVAQVSAVRFVPLMQVRSDGCEKAEPAQEKAGSRGAEETPSLPPY